MKRYQRDFRILSLSVGFKQVITILKIYTGSHAIPHINSTFNTNSVSIASTEIKSFNMTILKKYTIPEPRVDITIYT